MGDGKLAKKLRIINVYEFFKFIETIYPTDGRAVGRALSLGFDAALEPMAFCFSFASCLLLFFLEKRAQFMTKFNSKTSLQQ